MPALSSTSFSRTPIHLALPMAPLAHCAPATRGSVKPRELPEHWLTAASSTRGRPSTMSRRVRSSSFSTWPFTLSRKLATSISVGITAQCQRTKNWSLGVNTPLSNTSNGVSSRGGRVLCRIIGPFCGNALVIARSCGPPGIGRSTVVSAKAGAASAEPATTRKDRRVVFFIEVSVAFFATVIPMRLNGQKDRPVLRHSARAVPRALPAA